MNINTKTSGWLLIPLLVKLYKLINLQCQPSVHGKMLHEGLVWSIT